MGLLLAVLLSATESMKLALPSANAVNMDPKVAAFLGEHFASELKASGLEITTEREISVIVGMERTRALIGCNNESCIAELAAALGTDGVVLLDLARLSASIRVEAKVISARDGKTLSTCSDRAASEDAAADALAACARAIARQLLPHSTAASPTPVARSSALRTTGWVATGVGAAALITGVVFRILGGTQFSTLTSLHDPPLSNADAAAARDLGAGDEALGTGLIIGGVVATVAGVLLGVLAPEGGMTVALAPMRGGAVLGFSGALP
jgi:hypothetical protein